MKPIHSTLAACFLLLSACDGARTETATPKSRSIEADQTANHGADIGPARYTNPIGMELVKLPAGVFVMGAPVNEEGRDEGEMPQHTVRIARPFYMGVYEVTQAEYEAVMGVNPCEGEDNSKVGADYPVAWVSWSDAVRFCELLSSREGMSYRLPTEAEWEYACRAGTTTRFSFGDSDRDLDDYAWYGQADYRWGEGNPESKGENYAHQVGQKLPNPWGLHDMHGNLYEWCSDWGHLNYYELSPVDSPQGPAEGHERVFRGGFYGYEAWLCRSACRQRQPPDTWSADVGFRVVLESDEEVHLE